MPHAPRPKPCILCAAFGIDAGRTSPTRPVKTRIRHGTRTDYDEYKFDMPVPVCKLHARGLRYILRWSRLHEIYVIVTTVGAVETKIVPHASVRFGLWVTTNVEPSGRRHTIRASHTMPAHIKIINAAMRTATYNRKPDNRVRAHPPRQARSD
jgi:hypothetical protein